MVLLSKPGERNCIFTQPIDLKRNLIRWFQDFTLFLGKACSFRAEGFGLINRDSLMGSRLVYATRFSRPVP